MKCAECEFDYPAEILNKMFMSLKDGTSGYTDPICAICALDLLNAIHGENRKKFDGEMAEIMRKRAVNCRLKSGRKKNAKHE